MEENKQNHIWEIDELFPGIKDKLVELEKTALQAEAAVKKFHKAYEDYQECIESSKHKQN